METLTKILNDPKKKFIVFLALLFLIINSYWNLHSARLINDTLLEEKYIETKNCIDMLCEAVDANTNRVAADHEDNITASIAFMDNLPLTFAAGYRLTDEGVISLITERDYATNFDPLIYVEFIEAVSSNMSGDIILGFTPDGGEYRDMRIYYRWLPSYAAENERYLAVMGVSKYSVIVTIPALFTIGQWISTVILTILFLVFVYIDAVLGYIWFKRGKEPWRDEQTERGENDV